MTSKKTLAKFSAEIRQVKSRKLSSLDVEYTVVFTTQDGAVLNLGTIAGDVLVDVEVKEQA